MCLRCAQIFSDVHRCFQMIPAFDDPQLFDDLQLFDDQLEVWTLIIQNSTVIPPSLIVLFFLLVVGFSTMHGHPLGIDKVEQGADSPRLLWSTILDSAVGSRCLGAGWQYSPQG